MKKHFLLFLLFFLTLTVSCSSTNWVTQDDPSYPTQVGRMIGRGGSNLFCAPLELVNQPMICASGDSFGQWVGGLVEGVGRGIVYGTGRGISGLVDLGTFYFPHRGLMEPEFIEFVEYDLD